MDASSLPAGVQDALDHLTTVYGALPRPDRTMSPLALEVEATFASPGAHAEQLGMTLARGAPVRPLPYIAVAGEEGAHEPADLALTGILGQGGMGRVDVGTQLVFDRSVAVKRVRPDRLCASAVRALVHEASVTGSLDHPNIVPAFTFGRSFAGEPLLVLKRVEGVPWATLIHDDAGTDGEDPLARHLEILGKVCQAIESSHRRGVVHRDLKPDNVMVGDLGEVYVLDWGVAVRLSEPRSPQLAGTPAYMAPEMLRGSVEVSARTDVYLLGAMLHEVLTRRPPHEGAALGAVILAVHESAPFAYDDTLPHELTAICRRAMARDPADRFESALDFYEALRDCIRHRGSLELTVEAERTYAELQVALASSEATDDVSREASRVRVRRLAAETDFGFRQALKTWPENPDARSGRQASLERMIGFELAQRNAHGAEALLGELEDARPALTAGVAALRAELEEDARAKSMLAERRHQGDVSVAQRDRVRVLVFICLVFAPLLLVLGLLGFELTPLRLLWLFLGLLGLNSIVIYIRRASMFSTEANRRVQIGVAAITGGAAAMSALAHVTGATADAVVINYCYGLVTGVLGMMLWSGDRQHAYLIPPTILILLICAFAPGHTFYALSAGYFAIALAALPKLRRRVPPAEP